MKRYDYLCEGVAVVTTLSQTQQMFQIVSLILTCIATLFSICFTVYNWYKKAKEDGKIDTNEVKEISDNINKSFLQLKEEIEQNYNKKDGDNNG